ncbi:hypothetical protein Tco_1426177, partial [Tanacetum coccineum]
MTGVYSHTQVNSNTTNDILNKLLRHLGNIGIGNTTVANTMNHDPSIVAFHSGSPKFAGPNIGPTYPPGFPPQAQPSTYYYFGPNNQFPPAYTMPHAHFVQPGTKGPTTLSGQPTTLPHAFNTETLQTLLSGAWNMDTGRKVLRHLVSNNFISCNKEKPHVLCHACQLGKHVRLPFVSSNTVVASCFEIIHSD